MQPPEATRDCAVVHSTTVDRADKPSASDRQSNPARDLDVVARENLRRAEASAYLRRRYGIRAAVRTMAKWAWQGGGPPFYRDGKYPLYPVDGLDAWAQARLGTPLRSTSELREVA